MQRLFLLFSLLFIGSDLLRADAPNIVFITVDTTRADRMGFLGNTKGLTPNLDMVAHQGVVFEKA
jgi:arylsulfatase A-like enzyme